MYHKDCFSGIYVWKKGVATHSQSRTWALLDVKFMPWKKLIQLFCMTWGASAINFIGLNMEKSIQGSVCLTVFSQKKMFGGKNCFFFKNNGIFGKNASVFLKTTMFFWKKTCFWSNCKVSRCKFGVSLHQTYTSWGVSLHQTYIKLTLVKCKFDVNLHP